jgi:transmembrane sensor
MAERDPLSELARVRGHFDPGLDQDDVERLVRRAADRRQQRRSRRSLGIGLALGAAGTLLVALVAGALLRGAPGRTGAMAQGGRRFPSVAGTTGSMPPAPPSSAAAHATETWSLSDHSRATALEQGSRLTIEEDAPESARLRLERGRVKFEVTRRPERTFSVRAGSVTVSVIGTVFAIELVADRVGVSVDQGAVEVDWGVGHERLFAGESGWFPPVVLSDTASRVSRSAAPAGGTLPRASDAKAAASAASSPATVQELLTESDAARSRGDPARGAELLRRILSEHAGDPRAPLAAFTLGRVLLNELGKPREAAAAFHEVIVKAPRSQFAEDALAREVDAWQAASETARARALAKAYLERFPEGRHAARMKALSGHE